MRKTEFIIDTFPGLKLSGYTDDEDWNGWACPYFPLEEGQKIAEAQNLNGQRAWFDDANDQFVFGINGEEEIYPAIEKNGQKLYPIGNGSWIWEESDD